MSMSLNSNTYYDTDLGVEEMSEEELRSIALNRAGEVGSIGYGYARCGHVATRDGWRFIWIGTKGMGNYGSLIMKALTSENKELLREGTVRKIMAELGISHAVASVLHDCGKMYPHGYQIKVLKAALDTYENPCWDSYPGMGNGVNAWRNRWDLDELEELTVPRIDSVHKICLQIRKIL